ncbi:gastrula zinc finger protein XlCGF66.1-like [Mantella aurantiaca]
METDRSHMTERMLNLTLEIIYLLTGENYIAFKLSDGLVASNVMKIRNPVIKPPPHSLGKTKKVQEVTSEIIELLTGEVPIRCQDGTGYFSMEEWEYLEGHKDLYKDTTIGNQPSPGGNQNAWTKFAQKWGEHTNFMQEMSMLGPGTSALQG